MLGVMADCGPPEGQGRGRGCDHPKTNAVLRSIVRRHNGATTGNFLPIWRGNPGSRHPCAKTWPESTGRAPEETSSEEWMIPSAPDARVAKMKDGTTHLAHQAEHAVDMDSGGVIAVALQAGRI